LDILLITLRANDDMNIRGKARREALCRNYFVKPLLHSEVVGKAIKSDAGPMLTAEYYVFRLINKQTDETADIVTCGIDAATEIIEMSGCEKLPKITLRNKPEKSERERKGSDDGEREVSDAKKDVTDAEEAWVWDDTAKQLYDAVGILYDMWGQRSGSVLFSIMEKIRNNHAQHPSYLIKSVNTILSKDSEGRTLSYRIGKYRKRHPELKWFDFGLLNDYLDKQGIASFFG